MACQKYIDDIQNDLAQRPDLHAPLYRLRRWDNANDCLNLNRTDEVSQFSGEEQYQLTMLKLRKHIQHGSFNILMAWLDRLFPLLHFI
jgi:hypothetical protein